MYRRCHSLPQSEATCSTLLPVGNAQLIWRIWDSFTISFPLLIIDIFYTIKPLKDHGITFVAGDTDGGTRQESLHFGKGTFFMTQNHFQERKQVTKTNKQTNKQKKFIKAPSYSTRVHPQDDSSPSSPCFDSSDGQNSDGKTKLVTSLSNRKKNPPWNLLWRCPGFTEMRRKPRACLAKFPTKPTVAFLKGFPFTGIA